MRRPHPEAELHRVGGNGMERGNSRHGLQKASIRVGIRIVDKGFRISVEIEGVSGRRRLTKRRLREYAGLSTHVEALVHRLGKAGKMGRWWNGWRGAFG